MSDNAQLLQKTLRKNGYSATRARKLVFAALDNQEPTSMKDLASKLLGQIDRASLYRTINLFEHLGIVQRIQMGWKYKIELSDTFSYHHHHINCSNCGASVAMREDKTLEMSIRSVAGEYGYTNLTHQLEVTGTCPLCQKR